MEQPIPADAVRSTLLPLHQDAENAALRLEIAQQKFQTEGRVLLATHGLNPMHWQIDVKSGRMTFIAPTPPVSPATDESKPVVDTTVVEPGSPAEAPTEPPG